MFSFFKKWRAQPAPPPEPAAPPEGEAPTPQDEAAPPAAEPAPTAAAPSPEPAAPPAVAAPPLPPLPPAAPAAVRPPAAPEPAVAVPVRAERPAPPVPEPAPQPATAAAASPEPAKAAAASPEPPPQAAAEPASVDAGRSRWMDRLRQGLRKTGNGIAAVFVNAKIDEALYEELEAALLAADAGVKATQFLLDDLRRRVRDNRATDAQRVKALLAEAVADLLRPLQGALVIGEATPTVIMVVGVNGAGKTTSIGKLTRHLAESRQRVLLAAADTFRAAAREQLAVWADRNQVEIVAQEGGDPASVSYDAVVAGRSRKADVVIADTAGRLPTQLHLMEELKKIRRVIAKAQDGAPHEVLLVVDGNTGQNALAQVKAFDEALQLTGLVVTKLDGTAKGGVLAAVALWARERQAAAPAARPIAVYFIGVGEKLEDLQTFDAREFAQALLG